MALSANPPTLIAERDSSQDDGVEMNLLTFTFQLLDLDNGVAMVDNVFSSTAHL